MYILAVTYFAWILGYVCFNKTLPYSCTMHARYIITAIVIGIIYIGIIYSNSSIKLKNFILISSTIFITLSIIMFIYLLTEKLIILGI